jgi:molybdate transport system substrate-binding protein
MGYGAASRSYAAQEVVIRVYAAASLTKPMTEVIKRFEAENHAKVQPNFGPSGGLYAQITQGQPCDIYYPADWLYVEKLQKEGLLAEAAKFLREKAALIVSKSAEAKVKSVHDLSEKDVTVTIADPKAPAGIYAERALKKLGIWEKIVSGGNLKARPSSVNAVAVMVKEDQVDAGIVYVSVANQFNIKLVEVFSQELTGEIIFGVGIIKSGNQEWARKFREFVDRHIEEFVKWGWRSYE